MPTRRARPAASVHRQGFARCGVLLLAGALALAAAPARSLPLEITTTSLAGATAGVAYSDAVVAASGTTPYTWTLAEGTLPGGISLDGSTGALSGTATLAGTSPFVVLVTDALGDTTSRAFSLTVAPAAASALTFAVQPSAVLTGAAITPAVQVLAADAFGNPVAGVSVSLALIGAGTLSGGAAQVTDGSGVAAFSALSVDRAGSAELSASAGALGLTSSAAFTVSCPAVAVGPAAAAPGALGVAYGQTFTAAGGTAPWTFAVTAGALPSGLSLDGSTGTLSGTPGSGGEFDFTVTATDADLCAGARAYTIFVCAPITVSPASLPASAVGAAYSQSLSASGGVAPYAFAVTAGALPAGLTLSGAGLLAGTPTTTGVSTFTVTATAAGDCSGSTAYSLSVPGIPAAVTNLAVARLTSGNDGDGTSRMQVSFTPTAFGSTAEVYRAPFGGYPRYDDAGGLTPPAPLYPPGAPWVLTAVTASGQVDEPAVRDAWSYVVFMKNDAGQASAVSNQTPCTPNYALGDVSDGAVAGAGDNLVNDLDVSLLGAHYGIIGNTLISAGVSYLDVGPTTDFAVSSRPFTDARIDFEDLIVFATNYGTTSAPAALIAAAEASARSAGGPEHVFVRAPSLVEAGATFTAVVRMEAAGRVQGLSAELAWDAAVAEPIAVTGAGWVESQQGVVLSARPGAVDAALLGVRGHGLAGAGDLATVTFRALRAGDPAVRLARVIARDAANRPLGDAALRIESTAALPARTLLLAPTPNPAHADVAVAVAFALAQPGDVDLAIYSVDGRRVQVLAHGAFAAGSYRFTWNGADERQRPVAPGVFYAQLVAGGRRYTRTLVHLR